MTQYYKIGYHKDVLSHNIFAIYLNNAINLINQVFNITLTPKFYTYQDLS